MKLLVRDLGVVDYEVVWRRMQAFTEERTEETCDEFWLVQHPSVYTLGKGADSGHVLGAKDIPVIRTDRGGQVTFHGPGQLVIYTLLNVRRLGLGPKELVRRIEQGIINALETMSIRAERVAGAPGVYVEGSKVAALGLRIRKGCSFHGAAINVEMDLTPFDGINPCGYQGLAVTDLASLSGPQNFQRIYKLMTEQLAQSINGDYVLENVTEAPRWVSAKSDSGAVEHGLS